MALRIRNAVLHILRNDGRPSIFSENELDIDSEVCEAFIGKHVKKLLSNPAVREACFMPQSEAYAQLTQYQNGAATFKETALAVAQRLDGIMCNHAEIPPCDLLVTRVEDKGAYLAIIKLQYQECYMHEIIDKTAGQASQTELSETQLVKYNMALPFGSGKVEDACLIALDQALGDKAMPLRVIEKPIVVDGEMSPYFTRDFLACETTPSKKEQAAVIDEVTNEFIEAYYNNNPKASASVKVALMEEAEAEDGFVSMENVAARVFEENDELKQQYVETLREAGVRADVPLGARFTRQQFGTQRIKSENGVELKFPAELAEDEGAMEITNHADGTVTVVLKRLRMV